MLTLFFMALVDAVRAVVVGVLKLLCVPLRELQELAIKNDPHHEELHDAYARQLAKKLDHYN